MKLENVCKIVKFCSEECARQESGEISVNNMFSAWCKMHEWMQEALKEEGQVMLTIHDVVELGRLVEPNKNSQGFRVGPAVFRNGNEGARAEDLVRIFVGANLPDGNRIPGLLDVQYQIDADEFWVHFQKAHPFRDGNGRVGAILYNFFNKTLLDPIDTPNVKW